MPDNEGDKTVHVLKIKPAKMGNKITAKEVKNNG